MITQFLIVAAGGAMGAMARFALRLALNTSAWPWGTFAANVIGGLLMGLLVAAMPRGMDARMALFLGVGVLGGFTTFSSFSAESFAMLQNGQTGLALAYMAGSVILSIAALGAGYLLFDRMFS